MCGFRNCEGLSRRLDFPQPPFLCSPLPPSDTLQSEWLCQDGFARIILAQLGGQVLSSAIHFHFKRHGGTIWLLCAELVDQDWVHFNETLYVHCSEAELMRKPVMGSHPSE